MKSELFYYVDGFLPPLVCFRETYAKVSAAPLFSSEKKQKPHEQLLQKRDQVLNRIC
jgi:hypothetical protein